MARYKISNGDTYTIPDDDLEAIEVINTTYPDAIVLPDEPDPDDPLYTDIEPIEKVEEGSVVTEEGEAILRQSGKKEEKFQPIPLEEVVVTAEKYKEDEQKVNTNTYEKLASLFVGPLLGQTGADIVKSMGSLTSDDTETKDMSSGVSMYNTVVNSLNQVNTFDDRAMLTLSSLFGTSDILPNILGEDVGFKTKKIFEDTFVNYSNKLEKQSKLNKKTIGFTDLGVLGGEREAFGIGGLAATFNALTSLATTAGISAATGGVGLFTEMVGSSLQDYNKTKADSLGITVEELCQRGECETLVPLANGTVAYSLERLGLKGVTKYINQKSTGWQNGFFNLINVGNREGFTEFSQNIVEGFNRNLALGLDAEEATVKALDEGFSREGLEKYLQGFVGGAGIGGAGRLKARAGIRNQNENEIISKSIRELGELENSKYQKNLTKDQIADINEAQEQIKNQIASVVNKNNEIVAALTDDQITQIEEGVDLIKDLTKEIEDTKATTSLNQQTKETIIRETQNKINIVSQGIYDIRNTGEKIISGIEGTKKIAEQLEDVEVKDFANAQEVENFIEQENLKGIDKKESADQQAFVYQDPNTNRQTVVINRDQAAKDKAMAVGQHEANHVILYQTIKNNPQNAINLKNALEKELNEINVENIKDTKFKQRLEQYNNLKENEKAEEYLALFAEALETGDIKYKENIFTPVGDFIRRSLQSIGVNVTFNKGRDVYNFIKDINKSIEKGSLNVAQIDVATKGAQGELIETDIETTNEPTVKLSKTESNRIDDLVGPKTNGKYTMTKAQWDAGGLNAAYNDLILGTGLDALIGKGIFGSEVQGVSRDQFKQNVKDRLTDELLRFNPEVNNSLSGFINSRLGFRKGDELKKLKKTKAASLDDETSSGKSFVSNIADTTAAPETATAKTPVSKLRRIVGTDIASGQEVARTILKGKLPATTDRKIKSAINKRAREEYLDDVKALIDDAFLEEKAVDIINTLSIQDVVKLERGSKNKILAKIVAKNIGPIAVDKAIAQGKLPKETNRTSGPNLYERLPIDKTKLIEFLKPRKIAFAGVIAENLAKDAIPGVMSEPDTQQRRRNVEEAQGRKTDETDKVKVSSAIDRDPTIKFSQRLKDYKPFQDKQTLEAGENDFSLEDRVWRFIVKQLGQKPLDPKNKKDVEEFQNWVAKTATSFLPKSFFTSGTFAGAGTSAASRNFYYTSIEELNNSIKNSTFAKENKDIEIAVTKQSYTSGVGKNRKAQKKFLNSLWGTNKLIEQNKAKLRGLEKIFLAFEAMMKKDPNNAKFIIALLSSTSAGMGGFVRVSAPINFLAKNISGVVVEEHTLPASLVAKYLFKNAVEGKVKENFKYIRKNYFQGLLAKEDDNKLKGQTLDGEKYNYTKKTPEGWNIETDNIWARYFNINVANNNFGIDPNSIELNNGKTVFEVYGVNNSGNFIDDQYNKVKKQTAEYNNKILPVTVKFSKANSFINNTLNEMKTLDAEQTEQQIKFSKSVDLNKDFNDIIEKKTGIGTDKRYAKVKAQVAGASKGKFKFFIPPSAEDFVGLLYATLSKGKLGDAQMAWYKQNLLDPYAKAMNSISSDRISLMNDLKELKKLLKVIPKDLRSKVPGEAFTKEQAVRVYIWNSQGMSVPGLSKNDLKDLTDFVEQNENLKTFAEEVIQINKGEEYAPPDLGWVAGKIDTDLLKGLNTTRRSQYLKPWQDNVDVIFSEENLNKLEAAYGENYRIALEGILKRMKSGRNRPFADNSITGRVTDWLSNSVGAIMFFNTRSAVLQLLSTVNFVNFTDNNILKAGQAFANQPQYWKDVLNLMNSDFLKERRGGLRINVNEADIADMAKKSGARGVISRILQLGFAPTQIADSLAISLGGATFYRNRIKTLKKQGLTDKEAQDQAFVDFREVAEEAQQSSRPDRISEQQAGPLGRIILAFANTPAQYARIIKKAALDLKNGRGDAKTNLSKIIYYTFAQNFIFNALQQALFALSFGDDDDEKVDEKTKQKYFNIINSMSDSILRGIGIGGAVFSVIKNAIIKLSQQAEKPNPKYSKTLLNEALKISPPLSSKASKLTGIGWSLEKQQKEIKEKGFSLENPAYLAVGRAISFTTNIPADRALIKINNLAQSTRDDITTLERLALIGGWQDWELGIKKQDNTKVKSSNKRRVVKKKKSNKKRKF